MFSNLSLRLNHIFSHLTNRGKLTEFEIKEAMREIRVALLEADVNFLVAKNFVQRVSEKAIGQQVLTSLTPGQQVIKIVNEELVSLLGKTGAKLEVSSKLPTVIMLCGLQGSGKTTMCGKLSMLLKGQGKKPLLVACDIYRPAAIEQLKVVGKNVSVEVFEKGTQNVVKTCKQAIDYANKKMLDTVIIDTAGRLSINKELMDELLEIKKNINPTEVLLVVDAMNGQESVNVAKSFDDDISLTGVILTKLDGDTRGGAALSISEVVKKPIKFCGIGEKMGDIEAFYPDRMASRILGMGDVLTLIEKAQSAVSEEESKQLEKKFRESSFTFDDYLEQMDKVNKMGNINDLLNMIPGMSGKMKGMNVDEGELLRNKAIIQSMTKRERRNPELIKGTNKKRIASGSGTQIQDVNRLLKQFEQSKLMMKQMKNGKMKRFGF
ncbi:MAG: signal recognition particle protein [Clostridia bacterium]|nr:signal recognition particle protein [Clostridia bacterium]